MSVEQENEQQCQRIAELEQQLKELVAKISELTVQLESAQKRIAELEQQKTPPPPFVKANTKKDPNQPKKPRKKRAPEHNGVRRLEVNPTEIIAKKPDKCPKCQHKLGGISLSRKRQVIELPEPTPVRVTEYQLYKGWCANCQQWHEVELDLSEQVLGQGRFGQRIVSLIGYLRESLRLPIRLIQHYLATIHTLQLSGVKLWKYYIAWRPNCNRNMQV